MTWYVWFGDLRRGRACPGGSDGRSPHGGDDGQGAADSGRDLGRGGAGVVPVPDLHIAILIDDDLGVLAAGPVECGGAVGGGAGLVQMGGQARAGQLSGDSAHPPGGVGGVVGGGPWAAW